MAIIRRFEEIQAWQKARDVTRRVYDMTSKGLMERDFGLRDQLRRACVSSMANIAEGFGRRSDKEFANYLNIAHGSACEAQSHLYVTMDIGYLGKEAFEEAYAGLDEVARMTFALERHLRKSKQAGKAR